MSLPELFQWSAIQSEAVALQNCLENALLQLDPDNWTGKQENRKETGT